MTTAAGVSRGIPGAFPRIPADHTSPAARTVRPAVAHTTIGRTSGEATRAHADHAYDSNTAMSVSRCAAVGSRVGAVVYRRAHLFPSLSVDGASLATPSLRLRPRHLEPGRRARC